jgi:hypothetical protein
MTYLADLEVIWKEAVQRKGPRHERLRSNTLSGRDFKAELDYFHSATGDQRFADAAVALHEHSILDERENFTRWKPPVFKKLDRSMNIHRLYEIQEEIQSGRTVNRACAEVAARTGHRGNSFDAARKDLEKLYRRDATNLELQVDWRALLMETLLEAGALLARVKKSKKIAPPGISGK